MKPWLQIKSCCQDYFPKTLLLTEPYLFTSFYFSPYFFFQIWRCKLAKQHKELLMVEISCFVCFFVPFSTLSFHCIWQLQHLCSLLCQSICIFPQHLQSPMTTKERHLEEWLFSTFESLKHIMCTQQKTSTIKHFFSNDIAKVNHFIHYTHFVSLSFTCQCWKYDLQ